MADQWKKAGEQVPVWDYEAEGVNSEFLGIYKQMKDNVGPNNSKIYTFQKQDGTFAAVWGSTVVDGRMMEVPLGYVTKFIYLGKKMGEKGGREYHNFDIFYKPVEEGDGFGAVGSAPMVEDIPF